VFVAACDFGGGSFASDWFARTVSDPGTVGIGCGGAARLAPANVTITGQMVQPGMVTVGWQSTSNTSGPWSYALTMPPGTEDVFAQDLDHIALRRALSLTADTTLDTFDLSQEGSAYDSLPLAVGGVAADDTVTSDVQWQTANGSVQIAGTATAVATPPASLVDAADYQSLEVNASGGDYTRMVDAPLPGSTTFDLMPVLDGVTFEANDARWTTLPVADEVDFAEYAPSTGSTAWFAASPSWIAATNASQLGFADPPSDTWTIDPTSAHSDSLTVMHEDNGLWKSSSVSGYVGGATLRMLPVVARPGSPHARGPFVLAPR
jgi:hypothetical protein